MSKELNENQVSDDLIPNEGGSGIFQPQPSEEVVQEIESERSIVSVSFPIVDEIFKFIENEIQLTKDISSLNLNGDIESEVMAQRKLKDKLEALKNRFKNAIDDIESSKK